jgi:2-polyprenyl-3-methyl-5-hydroxy-6-metoxy-1,4-benzoquinol methylase
MNQENQAGKKYAGDWLEKNIAFYDDQAKRQAEDPRSLVLDPDHFVRQWDSYKHTYRKMAELGGKRVLDCGCGTGLTSCWMARHGATPVGIDVSGVSVRTAGRRAAANDLPRAFFTAASVYELPFVDAAFDVVVGVDILHHLNLAEAVKEVKRVLRDGGKAFFHEQIALSPALRAIRASRPVRAIVPVHAVEGEKELDDGDLRTLRAGFAKVKISGYHLVSRLDRILPWRGAKKILYKADKVVLRAFPGLTRYARTAVIELEK